MRERRLTGGCRVTGSNLLRFHIASQIDDRLAGKSAASALALFTTITHNDAGPFVRNTSFWAADIAAKLTCISPSNSTGSQLRAGVAITPRHVLYCKHNAGYPADGASIRFATAGDVAVARTQSQHLELTLPDMTIGLLSSDLPGTIVPCPVAPDNLMQYLGLSPRPPVLVLDQEEKGLVKDIDTVETSLLRTVTPVDTKRLEFHEAIVAGDSGDPWFIIVNNELVLIGTTMDVNLAACPVGINSILNAAIVSVDALGGVSTGYTVANPVLGAFSTVR